MRIRQIIATLTTAVALLTAMNSSAVSYTLTNSGVWNVSDNWNPNGIPTTGDVAIIATGRSITGLGGTSPTITTLTIQGTGALVVDAGTLTVSGVTTIGSSGAANLTVESGATFASTSTASGAYVFGGTGSSITNNGTFTCTGGNGSGGTTPIFQNNGTVTFTGSQQSFNSAVAVIQGDNAVLNLNSSSTTPFGGSSTLNASATDNTVTYGASGSGMRVTTYYNLTISNPNGNWNGGVSTINGTLTFGGTGNMGNVSGFTLNGNLAKTGSGTITCNAARAVGGNVTVSSGVLYAQYGINVAGTTTISGTGTLQLGNQSSGTGTFTGDFSISAGTFNSSFGGQNPAVSFGGNLTVSGGTFTAGTGAHTFSGTGKTITGTISIPSLTVSGAITNAGALTVSTTLAGAGTLTQGASSTLNIAAASVTPTLDALSNTPNTVNYNRANTQTVKSTTYDNLTLSAGNTKTLAGAATVNSTLTIAASTTLADGGFTLTAQAGVVNGGTHSGVGKILLTGGSGSHSLTGTGAYGNLELNDVNGASIASGTSTVNGTLTLTSGALSSDGGALTMGNSAAISRAAGSLSSLTPTFGTSVNVTYNDVNATTTGAEIPVSTTVLNNLTNNNAAGVILNANATLKGTLTLTSGSFDVGANTLTLNGPTIAGTPANLITTSSSSLAFGGSAAGVNVPSSVTSLNNLTINNANGLTLNSSVTVGGTLTLTSGRIATGVNTLTVLSTGNISGGSSTSYVNGTLDRGLTTSSTSALFPIGNASVYAPVSLASATITADGNLVVSTTGNVNSQGAFSSSGLSQSKYVNRNWTITAANGYAQSAGEVTFNFVGGDVQGAMNTATDMVGSYSGSVWTRPAVAGRTSTSITVSGITSFGDFVIGELPVPVFSNLSSKTNTYGTTSVALTGTLSANSGTAFPVNGSPVTASINGQPVAGTVTDSAGSFSINYSDASLATDGVAGSPYAITYSFAGDANLLAAANDTTTTLAIDPKEASVTADAQTKIYGDVNPALTAVTNGVINGDVIDVTLTTDATQFSDVGVSNIIVTAGSNPNYSVLTTNSTLTINQAVTSVTVASSENPSGLGVGVVFTATLPATATGSVNFLTNGILFSTEMLNGGVAMTTNSTLPQGTNLITAQYAGDGNYLGSTNDLADGQVVTNATQSSTSVVVSSSANPSGYQDSVLFTATLPANATSTVNFLTNGVLFDTQTLTGGVATSLSITSLPRGTNTIAVEYAGDVNYFGSTNSLDQVVTNHPPNVSNVSYTRNTAVNIFNILVSDLLTNATDLDGDLLTLASVSATTNSATITVVGSYVVYSNANAVADEFTYTVSDGFGGTNSATVTINVDNTPLFGPSQIVSATGSTATLSFAGIPGYSYSVMRSTDLSIWTSIWTTNAPVGGIFLFTDTNTPQPAGFYRLQFNP